MSRPGLLRWLLRALSTDEADMMALLASIADSDDEDAQALLEELAFTRPEESPAGPLRSVYCDGTQLLGPAETVRVIDIPRSTFYALVKRGAFPGPVSIDDQWVGWPRDVVLDWADDSARERIATDAQPGYAPFERFGPPSPKPAAR